MTEDQADPSERSSPEEVAYPQWSMSPGTWTLPHPDIPLEQQFPPGVGQSTDALNHRLAQLHREGGGA